MWDMAPSPSPELSAVDIELLFDLAEGVLATALAGGHPELPEVDTLPAALQEPTCVFVTLMVRGELNGCIGTIDADEPLGLAVPRLALSAAFADYRLPSLRATDFGDATIEVALLSPLEPMETRSRQDLVEQLHPGEDGVVIRAGRRQGLFLPKVWDQLPDPDDFLDHLWHKAGLVPRSWAPGTEALRFTARTYARRTRHAVGS